MITKKQCNKSKKKGVKIENFSIFFYFFKILLLLSLKCDMINIEKIGG